MEAAGPVVDIVVQSLMARIKKELGYWWNSRKNVQDMGSRMKQLSDTAEDIKRKKEAKDVNHLVVPHHVSPWMEDVKKINEQAVRIPTDGIGIGCFNIKRRYRAGKQSSDIVQNIDRLEERKSKIEWTDEQIPLARVPSRNAASTSSPVEDGTQNSLASRVLIFKEALKSLEPKNSKTHMMALCGMGGVGKTHMMELLKKAVEDSNMYSWVVKVVIGQKQTTSCQDAVAEYIGMPLTKTDKDVRAAILAKRFRGMSQDGAKKILVILDDLWKVLDLKDIGLPSPLPNGFKLLLTTRDADICTQMGVDTDSIFRIGALNDDEAKTLFFETVGLFKDDDPNLCKIGEDIVKRCGNLPIALKIIAFTLKGHIKDETEWEEALSRLQHHDIKDHYEIVHEVFKISYNSLKVKDEQAIFLLSGLFPDDFDIPAEELMRYAWGSKLLSKVSTIAKARRQVKVCVNKLISANLLVDSDHVGCVRMHDLARDFALSNITEVKQASIVNHDDMSKQLTQDANESFQRILLNCKDISEFPVDFNCPNLTFFKLMGGNEQLTFPQDFYENMEKLRVISYEEIQYPLLPRSLHCSTNITTLCLHGCELISDCSSIGDIVNLEVLSFANSRIELLPSSIGKLKKLKLLDLTGSFVDLRIDDGVFRGLVSLEELYITVTGGKAITFTDANHDELELLTRKLSALELELSWTIHPKLMSFKNIERFKISVGRLLGDDEDIHSFQNTLKLITYSSDLMECKINELFKKTEHLYLQVKDMKHLKDVTMQPSQHSFSKLKVLEVDYCKELRYLFTIAMASGLRQLEHLQVSACYVLESLIHDEGDNAGGEVITFKKLKFLNLKELPELKSLCDIDKRVELPQLVKLRLSSIPYFTSIYPDNAMQPFFNKKVGIPKLEKLNIFWMKDLKQIWPSEVITSGEEVQISMVREVEVRWCESLVNLFPINPMPLLHNLEKLYVKGCNSIEVLFNIDLGRIGKIKEVSGSLRSIHVMDLVNLRVLWKIKGVDNYSLLISGFQGVENIHIHDCKSYRYVITPNDANFDMRAVVDITGNVADRDLIFKKALNFLEPNNSMIQMVALCGMGSVGKTRMMEDLMKVVEDKGMFDLVLKLVVGREADPIALQEATAEYIGGAFTEAAKEARADSLHKMFMQISQGGKKKILVILDDLWEVLDLKDIGLPNPLLDGFKLLITSRDANVCTQMGTEKSSIFRLGVKDDAEAKTLFFETVGLLKDDDPDLYKIGEEIIIRCGNFPRSLETIASVLKGDIKDKFKWEEALSHLQNHDLEDIYDVLHIAFGMSYNNLKTDEEKAILFLCGFTPKDSYTTAEELMRYAWGLKLFSNVYTTLDQARHRIKASVDVLIHANFLTKTSSVQYVKMQHEAHDFVSGKFTKVKQAFINASKMAEGADVSYERGLLTCTDTSEFPIALSYPNLKLLKLMGEGQVFKFLQDFYDSTENLEVVAYERMEDPLLPQYSTTLRTLCLDSCLLTGDFSFLGNLINLEILSFAHCGIQKLPSTIGMLRKLKLLDVTGCVDLCIEDGVFLNLVNLEELYMRADDSNDILFTDANYEELETLSRQLCALEVVFYENKLYPKDGSFDKLEKFNISMGCDFDGSEIRSFENTLKLVTNRIHLLECKIHQLFEKTNRLYLQVKDMNNLGEVSMQYSFCCLRELEFSDCADLTFLFTVEVVSGLTKLKCLSVSSCPVLETLIHDENGDGSVIMFPDLESLFLEDLPRLMSFCDTDNRVELQQLGELTLNGLPNITTIFPDDVGHPYALFSKQVHMPNLDWLRIEKMEKLKQIWPCETATTSSHEGEVNNVSRLRYITVSECDSLKNLFPCNPLPLLNHLEELHIRYCGSIQVLFNIDLGGAANITQATCSLSRIEVEGLENLREIWRIKGTANDSSLRIRAFQAVKDIRIIRCRRFRDVCTPKNSNFEMTGVYIDDSS